MTTPIQSVTPRTILTPMPPPSSAGFGVKPDPVASVPPSGKTGKSAEKTIYFVGEFQVPVAPDLPGITSGIEAAYLRDRTGAKAKVIEVPWHDTSGSRDGAAVFGHLAQTIDKIMADNRGKLADTVIAFSPSFPAGIVARHPKEFLAFAEKVEAYVKAGGTFTTGAGDAPGSNFITKIPGVITVAPDTPTPPPRPTGKYYDSPEIDAYGKSTLSLTLAKNGTEIAIDGGKTVPVQPGLDKSAFPLTMDGGRFAMLDVVAGVVNGKRNVMDVDRTGWLARPEKTVPLPPNTKPPEVIVFDNFAPGTLGKNAPRELSHGGVVEGIIRASLPGVPVSRLDIAPRNGETQQSADLRVLAELDRILATEGPLHHLYFNVSMDPADAKIQQRLEDIAARGGNILVASGNPGTRENSLSTVPRLLTVGSTDDADYPNNPEIDDRQTSKVRVAMSEAGYTIGGSRLPIDPVSVDQFVRTKGGGAVLEIQGTSFSTPLSLVDAVKLAQEKKRAPIDSDIEIRPSLNVPSS